MACRVKTFVFDADGVVCVAGTFTQALERHHGIPKERLLPFFRGVFRECIIGARDLMDELKPRLSEWGWRGSPDEFLRFWFSQEHIICQDVMDCVCALRQRGHTCLLGTNQERYRTSYLRREMKLNDEFDGIYPSCELGSAKPSPEFFRDRKAHRKISRPLPFGG